MLIHVISHPCTLNYARRYRSSHRGPIGVVARQRETRAEKTPLAADEPATTSLPSGCTTTQRAKSFLPPTESSSIRPKCVSTRPSASKLESRSPGAAFAAWPRARLNSAQARIAARCRPALRVTGAGLPCGWGEVYEVSCPYCCPLPFPWVPAAPLWRPRLFGIQGLRGLLVPGAIIRCPARGCNPPDGGEWGVYGWYTRGSWGGTIGGQRGQAGQARLFRDRRGSCLAASPYHLFRYHLDEEMVSELRLAANQNQPLGNERFYETIERMAGQRREARPRGRPRLSGNVANEDVKGQGDWGCEANIEPGPFNLASRYIGLP